MLVGIKDGVKLFGISVMAGCAVLICTMFVNFYLDILHIEELVTSDAARVFYQAQVSTARVVCLVSGGCLLITSAVMLCFYIKHYIDVHKKELGILKALGYARLRIAGHFWVFGVSIFTGAVLGFCGAFVLMPLFYELQNKDGILPEISLRFHPMILLWFVLLPTAAFSGLAVLYACFRLRKPALQLLKENLCAAGKAGGKAGEKDIPFLEELRRSTVGTKKTLAFFILFSAFCFSAMTQMSFGMKELASEMMGVMMLVIGLILAFMTLFLAVSAVVGGNTKTIAMMQVFGYSGRECCRSLLDGYRPLAYVGFALGTLYQYGLLRVMVDVVFREVEGVPVYAFDFVAMLVSLAVFAVAYEAAMLFFGRRIGRISVKEIMLE